MQVMENWLPVLLKLINSGIVNGKTGLKIPLCVIFIKQSWRQIPGKKSCDSRADAAVQQ